MSDYNKKVSYFKGLFFWKKKVFGTIVFSEKGIYSGLNLYTIKPDNSNELIVLSEKEISFI